MNKAYLIDNQLGYISVHLNTITPLTQVSEAGHLICLVETFIHTARL